MTMMKDRGWIVWDDSRETGSWVPKITQIGLELLTDSIATPETAWSRPWDGKWIMVTFDLPSHCADLRWQLRTWLRKRRFGHLQGSVWISANDIEDWEVEMGKRKIDPSAIVVMEGRSLSKNKDSEYVGKAWDFDSINLKYKECLNFLERSEETEASEFAKWQQTESKLWKEAFEADPFLPMSLLPNEVKRKYLGPATWEKRKAAYGFWTERLATR